MSNLGTRPKSFFSEENINHCLKTLNLTNSTQNYMSNKSFKGKQTFLKEYGNDAVEFLIRNLNSSFWPLPDFNELRQLLDQSFNLDEYDILILLGDDMQLHPVLLGILITRQTKCNSKTHSIKTEAIRFMISKMNTLSADFLTAMYLLIRKYKKDSFGLVDGTPILNFTDFGGYRAVYESFNFANFFTKNGKMNPACENIQALKLFLVNVANEDILRNLSQKVANFVPQEEENMIEEESYDDANIDYDENMEDLVEEEQDIENYDYGLDDNDIGLEDLNKFDYTDEELYEEMLDRHKREQEEFIKENEEEWKLLEKKAKEISGLNNPSFEDVVNIMVKELIKDTKGGRNLRRKIK